MKNTFYHVELGLMPYGEALKAQEQVHAMVVGRKIGGALLTVQHPHVLTLGKNASDRHLLVPSLDLHEKGVELYRVERGGEITAHSPGQLVVYPIVPLSLAQDGLPFSPKSYVQLLERSVIELLAECGVSAQVNSQYPGVWIRERKICAIGVRIKQRVSLHGLALNINNDLGLFAMIVPCGIGNKGITSVCEVLGREIDISVVTSRMVALLAANLGINVANLAYSAFVQAVDKPPFTKV